jgi:phage terminase large subunit-like protein
MDAEDDWKDESKWIKANPNLLYSSTQLAYLKSQYKKAVNEGGVMEVNFKTKNLNMWTDASAVWIKDELLVKNNHGTKVKDLAGVECFGGLYTASTESLNTFVLFFPDFTERAGKKLNAFYCHSWLPERFVSHGADRVDYRKWVDEGFVTETPGNSADHRIIARDIIRLCEPFAVRVIGFDKTFGQYVAPDLEAHGFPVMEIYQGFNNLAQQTEEFKKLVLTESLEYFDNPVFRWQVGNTVTHRNHDGEEKPDKQASGSRIGLVSAALNAMAAKFNTYKTGVMTDFSFDTI